MLNIILQSIVAGSGGSVFSFLLMYIVILTIVIVSTYITVKNAEKGNVPVSAEQTSKVVLVSFLGGIIGAHSGSRLDRINKVVKKENEQGWKAVQIFHADDGGFFLEMLRALLLVCTLFLYTTANGYYIIMERETLGRQVIPGNQMAENQISENQISGNRMPGKKPSNILKCPNCGKEYASEMKGYFCEECGHKL